MLSPGILFPWHRHREKNSKRFTPIFFPQEANLVYCNDDHGLIRLFEIEYYSPQRLKITIVGLFVETLKYYPFVKTAIRLHKISLLPLFVEQSSQRT
ncbi:hypothetical protein PR048_019563 [Dryococelus australis]|uniref:Uncharacterized protein n=1 Tax=Dryococelus australis TaxID=614101 RepID=A0ABQ9H3T4_9NEOP|nr:hypothetical protein PR048_019563 [Dryococelus australis]